MWSCFCFPPRPFTVSSGQAALMLPTWAFVKPGTDCSIQTLEEFSLTNQTSSVISYSNLFLSIIWLLLTGFEKLIEFCVFCRGGDGLYLAKPSSSPKQSCSIWDAARRLESSGDFYNLCWLGSSPVMLTMRVAYRDNESSWAWWLEGFCSRHSHMILSGIYWRRGRNQINRTVPSKDT